MGEEKTKIVQLRNNEYYCMQEEFDVLNKRSKNNYVFHDLMKYINEENNIRLAYRNIKNNDGRKARGLSGKNMDFISNMKFYKYLKNTKKQLENYTPSMIKRVGIPKSNGKIRYLGIKEPIDKIVEQATYQVLSPILISKFHNNSNGFIEGRSCSRAISQMTNYIVKEKLYYMVDIDIKGFFDNIDHGKLLKQLWQLGIRDKNLLSIISKMLKAEVKGVGIPNKGTPQGGILSPLLANVVLNELDWWLDSKKNKGIRFVRYADDFKILCPTYQIASDMLGKTTIWLKKRLKLEVSEEKTKIVNLKKTNSYFLGFRFKLKKHKSTLKVVSNMTEKAIKNTTDKLKKQVREIKRNKWNKKKCKEEIDKYNSMVIGIHGYYCKAVNISRNLHKLGFIINTYINRNFLGVLTFEEDIKEDNFIVKTYGKEIPYIRGRPLALIEKVKYQEPRYKGNKIDYYNNKSRNEFYKELKIKNLYMIEVILKNPYLDETVEYNDNVISKFCGQLGKYAFTNKMILNISNLKIVKRKNIVFNNKYDNIILVENKVKELIEKKEVDDLIEIIRLKKGLTSKQLDEINNIRKENNLLTI